LKKKEKSSPSDSSKSFIKGMVFGAIVLLAIETSEVYVLSKEMSLEKSGKKMSMEDFKEAESELLTLQNAYEYFSTGGNKTPYLEDFTYEFIIDEYNFIKTAGIKAYLQECFNNKLSTRGIKSDLTDSELQSIYEEVLIDVVTANSIPLQVTTPNEIESLIDNYYGYQMGSSILNYHNFELTKDEKKLSNLLSAKD